MENQHLAPGLLDTLAMDEQTFDVIIVGAGPAGLSCARQLAATPMRVLVLEKSAKLGEKTCSGLISPKVFPDESFDRGVPWSEIVVGTKDTRRRIRFDRPFLWTAGRFELESRLLADCTAEVHFDEPVRNVTAELVETTKGRYRYRHLVGADGSFSKVRKFLGLPTENVAGWAYHFILDRPCPEFQMHWVPRELKAAYGYMMPKNRQQTMVGLAWGGDALDQGMVQTAKQWVARTFDLDIAALRHEGMKGNADYRGWRFGNVFLAGDAGGFLNPVTTEGIYFAMRSGEGVGRHLAGDPQGASILDKMVAQHRRQVRIFKLMTNRWLPLCWFIEWLFRNPEKGWRKPLFHRVFWSLME